MTVWPRRNLGLNRLRIPGMRGMRSRCNGRTNSRAGFFSGGLRRASVRDQPTTQVTARGWLENGVDGTTASDRLNGPRQFRQISATGYFSNGLILVCGTFGIRRFIKCAPQGRRDGNSHRSANIKIEAWRDQYNRARPHSALDYRTPLEFAALRAAGLSSAGVGQGVSNADPLPHTPIPAHAGDQILGSCRMLE
jgi:transposase InsO family protein